MINIIIEGGSPKVSIPGEKNFFKKEVGGTLLGT